MALINMYSVKEVALEPITLGFSDNGDGNCSVSFDINFIKMYSTFTFSANTSNANVVVDGVNKGYNYTGNTSEVTTSFSVSVPDSANLTLTP